MDPVFYRIFGDFTSSDRNAGSFYVKCAVGWDDGRRDLLGGVSWKYGGSNERAAGLGIMSFWCGILKIGERAGLIEALTKKMRPVIRFLFPNLPDGHPAGQYIATNMIANMLGLGWAATPAGLKAMEELGKLENERRGGICRREDREEDCGISGERRRSYGETPDKPKSKEKLYRWKRPAGTASNEMCTFLIINISSLQLIPINMIAYRSQYGSVDPAAIAGPALLATIASTAAGVVFCKVMDRKNIDF